MRQESEHAFNGSPDICLPVELDPGIPVLALQELEQGVYLDKVMAIGPITLDADCDHDIILHLLGLIRKT